MSKTIAQTYQVLDEISHVRKRTGMYAGSTSLEEVEKFVYCPETKKMELRKITVIPAFIKIVSEILDNAIDESRRAPEVLDSIRVRFHEGGSIEVTDNGRGIPVEVHPDTGKYVAETVFSNLRAGSNFNDEDDQQLIGTNGVGATLTNVLSTEFSIESCDGKKMFRQTFYKGMRERTEPKVTNDERHFTKITFTPDYEFFKLKGLDGDHKLAIIKKVVDAAATNTSVKFYIDGERVPTHKFSDYIAMYSDGYVYDENADWKVGVVKSDGYQFVAFCNSVETYMGGTHVTYAVNQIVDTLRELIKKKHKVEVSPADIRSQLMLFVSCNVNRPRFSSQTKENMISPPSEWKTSWSVPDKFIRKLMESEITQNILDWVKAKQEAELQKELRKAGKEQVKFDPRKVDKFSDAIERTQRHKCVLFLTEGDTLDENTEVLVLRDSMMSIPLHEIKVGDHVLTHMNRFRQVLSISPKVIQGVKIKFGGDELTISPEHRMIAYNTETREFCEVKGKDLRADIHKLVRNQCIDIDHATFTIKRTESDEFAYHVAIDDFEDGDIFSSATHRFFVFDTHELEYKLVCAADLNQDRHLMALRQE